MIKYKDFKNMHLDREDIVRQVRKAATRFVSKDD